jgi:hypothetical protein
MTTVRETPADITMMSVVHDAIRRDLRRLHDAVADPQCPPADRARALGVHTLWMVEFLHDHHRGEDAGLWPVMRARHPESAALLDQMETDHAAIHAACDTVKLAARRYTTAPPGGPGALVTTAFLDALTQLSETTLPHLAREENDMMPIVSVTITDHEWRRWDAEHNIRPRTVVELGTITHWLIDGLDPQRYVLLTHLVPAPLRVLLVHGFRRRYRRDCALRWGPNVPIGPLPRNSETT